MRLEDMSDAMNIPAKRRYIRSCQSLFDIEFNAFNIYQCCFHGRQIYTDFQSCYHIL